MRRVATALRSGTASLYRCVDSREELLDLMVDAVLGDDPHPPLGGPGGRPPGAGPPPRGPGPPPRPAGAPPAGRTSPPWGGPPPAAPPPPRRWPGTGAPT